MENRLYSVEEVISFINNGELLALAGDEKVLSKLPKGNWIGGTIPYFMDEEGGKFSQELIYVNKLSNDNNNFKIVNYNEENIESIINDSFDNGFTFIIIPAFQKIHQQYALASKSLKGLYNNPIVGWVSGVDLNSYDEPKTFNGLDGKIMEDYAVAIHIELPADKFAQIDIVNIFEQDENSPEIEFYTDDFDVVHCLIDGQEYNFASYLTENNIDVKLPIVADYSGASINVSIKEVDVENGFVSFYAPVFADKKYKFAKPVHNYVKEFENNLFETQDEPMFACNCILNYLYGELEGKKIGNFKGPVTFGEIAYKLLNQTLVTLTIDNI